MEHSKKVLCVTFISHDQTSEVLQPSKKPLDFPVLLVSLNLIPLARSVETRQAA